MTMRPQNINNSSSAASGGIGVLGFIQALLIVGKFIDADWNKAYDIPWIWVFTPIYIGVALTVIALVMVLVALFVADK